MTKKVMSLVTAIVILSQTISFSATKNFKDISKSYWAKSYIDKMTGDGYFKGYPDNTFRPDKGISRLEFMITLSRAISNIYKGSIVITQSDLDKVYVDKEVKDIKWALSDYKKMTEYLYLFGEYKEESELGRKTLMSTFGDKFQPNKPITRAEVASLLYNIYNKSYIYMGKSDLNDISKHKFATEIKGLESIGILSGYPNKTFKPNNSITRAEVSKILDVFISKKAKLQNINYNLSKSLTAKYDNFLSPTDLIKTVIQLEKNGDYQTAYEYYSQDAKNERGYKSYLDYMKTKLDQVSFGVQTYDPKDLEYKEVSDGNTVKVYFRKYNKELKAVETVRAKELIQKDGKWYIDFKFIPLTTKDW